MAGLVRYARLRAHLQRYTIPVTSYEEKNMLSSILSCSASAAGNSTLGSLGFECRGAKVGYRLAMVLLKSGRSNGETSVW
jgi:hypothetical protein